MALECTMYILKTKTTTKNKNKKQKTSFRYVVRKSKCEMLFFFVHLYLFIYLFIYIFFFISFIYLFILVLTHSQVTSTVNFLVNVHKNYTDGWLICTKIIASYACAKFLIFSIVTSFEINKIFNFSGFFFKCFVFFFMQLKNEIPRF